MERAYTYQQPPVESRLNYERKRPDFTATTAFPISTTSASFVVFQLGEDVLIESTTDHHGKVGANFGKHHLKIPASHNVLNKAAVRQPQNRYIPPANNNYHQQQQVPKIKIKSPARSYVEPTTIVSTLPPPPPSPSPSSYNNINLNHINSLPSNRPVSSIQHELQSIDTYGTPPAQQHTFDTFESLPEQSTQAIYLPTSTSSDSYEQNVPEQEHVQFLAPAQPVYTTATETADIFQQLPFSEESVTFEEIPSPEQVVQTTFVSSDGSNNNNNNYVYQTHGLPSYQNQQTVVIQQQVYQENLPVVISTPTPLENYQQTNFNSGPVVFEQSTEYQPQSNFISQAQPTAFEQSTEFQSPVQIFQTSEAPIQPAQDVFSLPVYQQPRFEA